MSEITTKSFCSKTFVLTVLLEKIPMTHNFLLPYLGGWTTWGGWTKWHLKVSSNQNYSMIPLSQWMLTFADTRRAPCKDCKSHKVMTQGIFLAQFDCSLIWWLVQYVVVYAKPSCSVMKWLRHCREEKAWRFVCGEFTLQGWPVWRGVVEACLLPTFQGQQLVLLGWPAHTKLLNEKPLTCVLNLASLGVWRGILQSEEPLKSLLYLIWRIGGDSCPFGTGTKPMVHQQSTAWHHVLLCKG